MDTDQDLCYSYAARELHEMVYGFGLTNTFDFLPHTGKISRDLLVGVSLTAAGHGPDIFSDKQVTF